MPRFLFAIVLVLCATTALSPVSRRPPARSGHYLFVWAGDQAKKGNDFLVVIDADSSSASYGHLVTTVATDQQTMRVHHTEYTMPASGMLFANDHDAGRTFIFDVRDPLHPTVETSFTDMAGYMHPHSYVRLPNGHVLATFQDTHHTGGSAQMGESGGLVEIDDRGNVVRSASSADPAFPRALLTPYGLVVMPGIDRVVSTNSSMQQADIFSGVTYQVWRLSDLKLLGTSYLDVGADRYAHISPEEPRLGPDGSVLIQTLGCGLERVTDISASLPKAQLVYGFPGNWCGVPTVVGHYLVQSVPAIHGFIVLDIANGAKPVEVSRVTLSDSFFPHWSAWDPETQRLVATSGSTPPDNRLYLLKLSQATGAITVDSTFHDADGKPGFSFGTRQWPHGWTGAGTPHGAVFSR
jgi:hypothetical protein